MPQVDEYDIHLTVTLLNTDSNRALIDEVLQEAVGVDSYTIDMHASNIDVRIQVVSGSSPYDVNNTVTKGLYAKLPRGAHIQGAGV